MSSSDEPDAAVSRAFGQENRGRLLDLYFSDTTEVVLAATAWKHVYRLLMWIDRTIGLAHCYESDKCQPGRPWYARSLRFHQWLADELAVLPAGLSDEIDWLFSTASRDLALEASRRVQQQLTKSAEQRRPYAGLGMPLPGEDPELEQLIADCLAEADQPAAHQVVRTLSGRIQAYVASENKRKNLVGEGFEDTLLSLLRRIPDVGSRYDVVPRPLLHDLPGFYPPRGLEKVRKVDLALVRRSDGHRTLVSCKWSVRSDREEQFRTDHEHYSGKEASGKPFDYVLITNEFDAARLDRACEMRRGNELLFSDVVHVNPGGVESVYATPVGNRTTKAPGTERALAHIRSGRLASLEQWLFALGASAR